MRVLTVLPNPTPADLRASERQARPEVAVEFVGVSRTYPARGRSGTPRVALADLDLHIPSGQRLALLGPNGSGKTTLLRLIALMDRPDSGTGAVLGCDAGAPPGSAAARAARARLGVVFQAAALDRLLTVRENLLAQASLFGLRGPAARGSVERAAGLLVLSDRLDDRFATLSGGLARRADLARALLHDPDMLLLDEPTAGLDPRSREEFLDTLEAVASTPRPGRPRVTILLSTHLMDEAQRAQRVVMLDRGRLVADGAPAALRRDIGGLVLRCDPPGEAAASRALGLLAQAGLLPERQPSGRILARADGTGPDQLGATLAALARAGVAVEIGPATLGDVFLARTGRLLDESQEPPQREGAHHPRRQR
ncbi:MAG TPA: ABC transporter ATP-binding protein [Phycisphaerales bacterium]|nr:ABC transporter ATP-binding protein [Phycisphaerales bacterium]